ncbi:MAG: hypothetical protein ACI4VX_07780 [Succinivibrionaceae bacterium]
MLIAFRAENFKCFSQEVAYSFLAETSSNVTVLGKTPIYNQLAINGSPSSGKTVSLEILKFIKKAVSVEYVAKFPLITSSGSAEDTTLEIVLSAGEVSYSYGFSFNRTRKIITGEWINLLQSDGQSLMIFSRDEENFSLTYHEPVVKEDHKYFDMFVEDIAPDQLALSALAKHNFNSAPSLKFFTRIRDIIVTSLIEIFADNNLITTNTVIGNPELCDLSSILNQLDTGITAVSLEKCSQSELSGYDNLTSPVCIKAGDRLLFVDNSDNNIALHEIKFCHDYGKHRFTLNFGNESSSNRRLIELALLATNNLPEDTLFIVDDLHQHLSPEQTDRIVRILRDKTNADRQQILFTAGDFELQLEGMDYSSSGYDLGREQRWCTRRLRGDVCISIQDHPDYDDQDVADYDNNESDKCSSMESLTEESTGSVSEILSETPAGISDVSDEFVFPESPKEIPDDYLQTVADIIPDELMSADSFDADNLPPAEAFISDNLPPEQVFIPEDLPLAQEFVTEELPPAELFNPENLPPAEIFQIPDTDPAIENYIAEQHPDIPELDPQNITLPREQLIPEADPSLPSDKPQRKVRLTVKQVKEIIRSWGDLDTHSQNSAYIHIRNNKIDVNTLTTREQINQTFIDMYNFLIEKESHKKYSRRLGEYQIIKDLYLANLHTPVTTQMVAEALEKTKATPAPENFVPAETENLEAPSSEQMENPDTL